MQRTTMCMQSKPKRKTNKNINKWIPPNVANLVYKNTNEPSSLSQYRATSFLSKIFEANINKKVIEYLN